MPRCASCRFWRLTLENALDPVYTVGACYLNPPFTQLHPGTNNYGMFLRPSTYINDFCSHHQPLTAAESDTRKPTPKRKPK